MLREALRVKLSAGPAMGARRGRQDLSAGSGESWEACEQGSDLVRRRLAEVRLAPKSPANVPLPPRHLQALVSIRPRRPMAPLWPGPLPATSQRPRPALAFLPAHPPHLTAKSTLLPSRGGSAASGPQGQEPNLACPRALFPEHSPLLPRLQAPPSKGVTLGHSMPKAGPGCRGTPSGSPDTARGGLALWSRTSGTPSSAGTPLNSSPPFLRTALPTDASLPRWT